MRPERHRTAMAPCPFPISNATVPYWRAEPHPLDSFRSTELLPSMVDIAIVGAGYAGASMVHHILDIYKQRSMKPPSIVILEAREACSGLAGRNCTCERPCLPCCAHRPALA